MIWAPVRQKYEMLALDSVGDQMIELYGYLGG